jgi:hypothetical protein
MADCYPTSGRTGVRLRPWLKDVAKLKRALEYARRGLQQRQAATPGSLSRWHRQAFDEWIVELFGIMKRRGLPSGPGATDTKDTFKPARFSRFVQALQKYALPAEVRRRSMTAQAIDKRIQRALQESTRTKAVARISEKCP